MSRLLVTLLCSALLSAAAYAADPAAAKDSFLRRLDSVKALTSALQRDKNAGTPLIKEALASVGARQKDAEDLAAVGEYEVAASILDEGYKKLTATLTKAKAGEGYQAAPAAKAEMSGMTGADGQLLSVSKQKADVERKSASAAAMLDAAKRTDAAKGGTHGKELAALEAKVTQAKSAASAGDFKTAERLIDQVLIDEKQLIAGLASGSGYRTGADASAGNDAAPSDGKGKADYERKLSSAGALLDAAKRVDGEKGNSHRNEISAIEGLLKQAKAAAAGNDWVAANRSLDEVLGKEKQIIASTKSDAGTAGLKTGSAAISPDRDLSGMTGEERKTEIAKTLRSAGALRDLIARRSQERGVDGKAAVGKIEQLIGEARRLEASDPTRALQMATNAYEAARAGVEGLSK